MADTPALTPRDYDAWALATPLQLLTLLERLDVSMSEVGRWLHVPRSSISMWRHGTRSIPQKHIATLRERTRSKFDETAQLTAKAAELAPSADVGQAILAEFQALWARWASEVRQAAETYRRAMERQYADLGTLVHKPHFTAEDPETARLMGEALAGFISTIYTLEPQVPSAQEALIAQLTAAHAQTIPPQLTAEERAEAESDMPDRLATPPDAGD
jgi:hypothetical protein